MTQLTQKQYENAVRAYKHHMANARSIKKHLEKSWMRSEVLEAVNQIIDKFTLNDYIEEWLYDRCNRNHVKHISMNDWISKPIKIKSFSPEYLELIKRQYEAGIEDSYYTYWSYDYSIHTDPHNKKAWYNREYKWCWNGYYYLMVDLDTAFLYEID